MKHESLVITQRKVFEGHFQADEVERVFKYKIIQFSIEGGTITFGLTFSENEGGYGTIDSEKFTIEHYDSVKIREMCDFCKKYSKTSSILLKWINYAFYCQGLYGTLTDSTFTPPGV
jgi:hypothetical protein